MKLTIHGVGIAGLWAAIHALKRKEFSKVTLIDLPQKGEAYRATCGVVPSWGTLFTESKNWQQELGRNSYYLWMDQKKLIPDQIFISGRMIHDQEERHRNRMLKNLQRAVKPVHTDYSHPLLAPTGGAIYFPDEAFIKVLGWRDSVIGMLKEDSRFSILQKGEGSHLLPGVQFFCTGAFPNSLPVTQYRRRVVGINCQVEGKAPQGIYSIGSFHLISNGQFKMVGGGKAKEDEIKDLCKRGDKWIEKFAYPIKRISDWEYGFRARGKKIFPVWGGNLEKELFFVNSFYKQGLQLAPAITQTMIDFICTRKGPLEFMEQFLNS